MSVVATHGFSRVLTLVFAMIMATLPFLGTLPAWLTLGIIVLAVWRVISEQRGLVIVPRVMYRLLIALVVTGLLMLTNDLGFGLTAATPLFVSFLWIKLLELKARRDYLLVCFLCYFLVSVLLCDNSSLVICLYAMATMAVITMALVGYHMDGKPSHVIRLGLRLTVTGLPIAIIVFLLFPRLQIVMPNMGQATSGFTDNMTPGDVARMALSEEPIMRVEFPNNDMPPADQLYWRGLVMSITDGTTWRVKKSSEYFRNFAYSNNTNLPAITQEITLEPLNQKWLFALDVAETPPDKSRLHYDRSLARTSTPTQVLRYQVTSRLGDKASDYDSNTVVIPESLDPRVRQLAQQWRDQYKNPQAIIEACLTYFKVNNFTYSLSPGVMEGDDVSDFLFTKRAGFCSHYATSFALLMRCAGLPARVVIGFHRGDLNPVGNFLIIRQDHAHAWSEVQINDEWIRVDPTKNIPLAPGETQPAALRNADTNVLSNSDRTVSWLPEFIQKPYSRAVQYYQYIEAKWESTVMGYDSESQYNWLNELGINRFATPVLFGGMVVFLLGAVFTMLWWRRSSRNKLSSDPLVVWYQRYCEHLAEAGVERLPYEGPRDFSRRAAQALPDHAALIIRLGDDYIAMRYGVGVAKRTDFARLQADLRLLPKRPATHASAASIAS